MVKDRRTLVAYIVLLAAISFALTVPIRKGAGTRLDANRGVASQETRDAAATARATVPLSPAQDTAPHPLPPETGNRPLERHPLLRRLPVVPEPDSDRENRDSVSDGSASSLAVSDSGSPDDLRSAQTAKPAMTAITLLPPVIDAPMTQCENPARAEREMDIQSASSVDRPRLAVRTDGEEKDGSNEVGDDTSDVNIADASAPGELDQADTSSAGDVPDTGIAEGDDHAARPDAPTLLDAAPGASIPLISSGASADPSSCEAGSSEIVAGCETGVLVSAPAAAGAAIPDGSHGDRPQRRHVRVSQSVAWRAGTEIDRAISLAERGAYYSSRASFIRALSAIAQALDAQNQTASHGQALAAGIRALDEARDFVPDGSMLEADLRLEALVLGHSTPVLKGKVRHDTTALYALQQYHIFAEQQLAWAGGQEPLAAEALFGLGRLQRVLNSSKDSGNADGPRAMSFFQSALMVNPEHALAANELGVLFALYGQWEDARQVLEHCVRVAPTTYQGWQNLAYVHRQLGQHGQAQLAEQEAQLARRWSGSESNSPYQTAWVDPRVFSSSADYDSQTLNVGQPDKSNPPASRSASRGAENPTADRPSTSWLERLWKR